MSLTKISSFTPTETNYPDIVANDYIKVYFAIFRNIMTDISELIVVGTGCGYAGEQTTYEGYRQCSWIDEFDKLSLNEKSIWMRSNIIFFVQPIKLQSRQSGLVLGEDYAACMDHMQQNSEFGEKVGTELKLLKRQGVHDQDQRAEDEIRHRLCVAYRRYT